MRLFFVVGSFKLGGTERTASRIGIELLRRGYDVKFILINNVFDYSDDLLINNSIVLVRDKGEHRLRRLIRAWWKLVRMVWRERPDYLVSFSMGINVFCFFTFYRRLVFRIESNMFIYKTRTYRRYSQKLMALAPNVKKVVVPSGGLYQRCAEYFLNPEKLVQISNPLPIEAIRRLAVSPLNDFPNLREGRFIVTAGRLHASKGFAELIQAFSRSALKSDFKLVILGDGPMYRSLLDLIRLLRLEGAVFLTGYQENPYRFMSRARFFVLNSAHESFGNVLIESMGCGTPVMSNDCDFGPRHIIRHGYNGLLYDRENEYELIAAMESLAFDDELYYRLKEGAVLAGSNYNVTEIVNCWESKLFKGTQ